MMHLPLGLPGWSEMAPIAILLLIFFGGRKLPELARAMGTSITQFKKGLKEEDHDGPRNIDGGRPPEGE